MQKYAIPSASPAMDRPTRHGLAGLRAAAPVIALAMGAVFASAVMASQVQAKESASQPERSAKGSPSERTGSHIKRTSNGHDAVTMEPVELLGAVSDPHEADWQEVATSDDVVELPMADAQAFLDSDAPETAPSR